MEKKFIKIVEDYLENRRLKTGITDLNFRNRLEKLGLEKEKIGDLILKMDDEWTKEQYLHLELKKAKMKVKSGYVMFVLGLFIFFISFSYNQSVKVLPIGVIVSGIVFSSWAKTEISRMENILRLRKIEWKSWVS